jgi:hypothetical protein
MTERGPAATVDDDLRWTAVSAPSPCPVCNAPDGCGVAPFRGGVAVDCRRVVSRWPMTQGGWLHRLPAPGAGDDASHGTDGATCAFPMPTGPGTRAPPAAGNDGAWAPPTSDRSPITRARGATTMETVLGAFETRRMAEVAVDDLLAAGFRADELSVLGRHGDVTDLTPENETADKTVAGAGIGAAIGGFGSIALGLVVAAIPGIGPVVALGPFAAALGGGVVGGLIGFFAAHGIPERDAALYAERVRAGAYVVAVHTDDGLRAESVLAQSGAEAPIRHSPG